VVDLSSRSVESPLDSSSDLGLVARRTGHPGALEAVIVCRVRTPISRSAGVSPYDAEGSQRSRSVTGGRLLVTVSSPVGFDQPRLPANEPERKWCIEPLTCGFSVRLRVSAPWTRRGFTECFPTSGATGGGGGWPIARWPFRAVGTSFTALGTACRDRYRALSSELQARLAVFIHIAIEASS
jgi:hypothetical protein